MNHHRHPRTAHRHSFLITAAVMLAGVMAPWTLFAQAATSAKLQSRARLAPSAMAAADTPFWMAAQIIEGGAENGIVGFTVSSADVNGDGYADIISSQQVYPPGSQTPTGSVVLVYYGSPSGPQLPPQQIISPEGADVFNYFGEIVASAGDVNGDGYDDILVNNERGGDSGNPNNFDFRGTVYLYLGSAEGLSATPAARLVGDDIDGGKFGFSIATAGDVDGDGYADVLVGENSVNPAQDECVFIYYGSPDGLSEASRTRLTAHTQTSSYGANLNAAGDVNGDGYADVIIGAPGYQSGTSGGSAFVYAGSAAGIVTEPLSVLSGDLPGGDFGFVVNGVGDLDGDGYDDVMVGTDCEPTGGASCDFPSFPGAAWVFNGSASGVSAQASAKLQLVSDDGSAASFGFHIEPAGDVNGDGIPDVAVTALAYNGLGAVLIYEGPLTSASQPAAILTEPDAGFSLYAFRFSMGDVDGDGRKDPIVGAGFYSSADASAEGAIYFYPSRDPDRVFADGFDVSSGQL
jgi:hypothetical protein